MFSLSESNRYVVCVRGVDLRKGLDGLCGLIHYLSLSSSNGDVYVFWAVMLFTINVWNGVVSAISSSRRKASAFVRCAGMN
jgi:hypothetical protein